MDDLDISGNKYCFGLAYGEFLLLLKRTNLLSMFSRHLVTGGSDTTAGGCWEREGAQKHRVAFFGFYLQAQNTGPCYYVNSEWQCEKSWDKFGEPKRRVVFFRFDIQAENSETGNLKPCQYVNSECQNETLSQWDKFRAQAWSCIFRFNIQEKNWKQETLGPVNVVSLNVKWRKLKKVQRTKAELHFSSNSLWKQEMITSWSVTID